MTLRLVECHGITVPCISGSIGDVAGDTLPPGKHSWPFLVRLPAFLPSSYDGQWGRVQYTAKAVLERPWKGDIQLTKNFLVLGLLDLNTEPDAKVRNNVHITSDQ